MRKEDLKVYSNTFVMGNELADGRLLTSAEFRIEVAGNTETEKEILDFLKKSNPTHASLNSPDTVFHDPAVSVRVIEEYLGMDYQHSELYSARFTVTVDEPIKCDLKINTGYSLPEYEEIEKILKDTIEDYEKACYKEMPEKYLNIEMIHIENYNEDTGQNDLVSFKPQPDGTMIRTFVSGDIWPDDKEPYSVTIEDMESEIQNALRDNMSVAVCEKMTYTFIPYSDWEKKQQAKSHDLYPKE